LRVYNYVTLREKLHIPAAAAAATHVIFDSKQVF
jgi:hypothetical protein